jgi:uncharacterized protein YdbL (DUF1318 family)
VDSLTVVDKTADLKAIVKDVDIEQVAANTIEVELRINLTSEVELGMDVDSIIDKGTVGDDVDTDLAIVKFTSEVELKTWAG